MTAPSDLPNVMSRGKWAKLISAAWQKQVPSILEVAALLESAEAELRKRDWTAMVKTDLPFKQSAATKLVKIAKCDHFKNSDHGPSLPACWRTLFELTLLSTEQFEAGIKSGKINPCMQRKDVKALRGDEPAEPRISPMALLKRQLDERIHEIAYLQEKLAYADQGSLFDLRRDSVRDIADVVACTITESKAIALADAIKAAIKAKKNVTETA